MPTSLGCQVVNPSKRHSQHWNPQSRKVVRPLVDKGLLQHCRHHDFCRCDLRLLHRQLRLPSLLQTLGLFASAVSDRATLPAE